MRHRHIAAAPQGIVAALGKIALKIVWRDLIRAIAKTHVRIQAQLR